MAAYRRVYDSRHLQCRLTAKNRDQLRNPALGNAVWATFPFFYMKQMLLCGDECLYQTGNGLREDPTTRGSEPLNRIWDL